MLASTILFVYKNHTVETPRTIPPHASPDTLFTITQLHSQSEWIENVIGLNSSSPLSAHREGLSLTRCDFRFKGRG